MKEKVFVGGIEGQFKKLKKTNFTDLLAHLGEGKNLSEGETK